MNIKKLVSAVSALAMSASVFAGLAVTANADTTETKKYGEAFTDYAAGEWLTKSGNFLVNRGAEGSNPTIQTETGTNNKFWKWDPGSGNGRGFYLNLPSAAVVDTTLERVKFDFVGWGLNNSNVNGYYLLDNNSNQILRLTYPGASSSDTSGNLMVNGVAAALDGTAFTYQKSYYGNGSDNVQYTWYTFDAVLDFGLHTFSYNIYPAGTNADSAVASASNIVFDNTAASNLSRMGVYYKGTQTWFALDNFETYSIVSTEAKYPYVINYVCGEETIYTESGSATEGATVLGSKAVLTADETLDGNRYYRISETDLQFTVEKVDEEEVNTFEVPVRAAEVKNYTVKGIAAGDVDLGEFASGTITEGLTTKVNYPKYIVKDDVLYTVGQGDKDIGYYAVNVTGTQADQTIDITYAADSRTPVFFSEGEDIGEDSRIGNSNIRCSNGAVYNFPAGPTTIVTLPAGTYNIESAVWGTKGNTYTFNLGDDELTIDSTGSLNPSSKDFTLTDSTTITVTATGSAGAGVDYILITGEVAPAPTPATATSALVWDSETNAPGEYEGVASAWNVTVTPGSAGINTIAVTVDGGNADKAFESSTVITEGTVVLGVAVAKAAAGLVLNVAVNGESITVE